MPRSFKFHRVHKPARDFFCALAIFSALFVAMSPSSYQSATIPVLSLFAGSTAEAATIRLETASAAPRELVPLSKLSFSGPLLSPASMPLISTVLAIMFSAIIAFNLALLRHLRRVNGSSRRGAWKEG